jgi:predicted transcriptional regulator
MTRITRDNFEKAVINTGGVKSSIAKRLKVSRSAITKYCDRNPWTEEVLNEEIEAINDLAENKLFELIVDKDYKAIKLRLTTKARDRGYVERQEIATSIKSDLDADSLNKIWEEIKQEDKEDE